MTRTSETDRRALDTAPNGVPRLALTRQEAAKSLGLSIDSFERHVQPELRCTYAGSKRMYSIDHIRAWLDRNAVSP